MISKAWMTARIDQAAARLQGSQYTPEEIAALAIGCGLEWAATWLRESIDVDRAGREKLAAELDVLRADLPILGAVEDGETK